MGKVTEFLHAKCLAQWWAPVCFLDMEPNGIYFTITRFPLSYILGLHFITTSIALFHLKSDLFIYLFIRGTDSDKESSHLLAHCPKDHSVCNPTTCAHVLPPRVPVSWMLNLRAEPDLNTGALIGDASPSVTSRPNACHSSLLF